jgi:uncharacterized protein YjiS (DUF1127 family)
MHAIPTVTPSNPSSFATTDPGRLADIAGRIIDLLATWHQREVDRRQLRTLDDGMLRDIGLSRADLEFESSKPFWRN